jgi:hypothetical protein
MNRILASFVFAGLAILAGCGKSSDSLTHSATKLLALLLLLTPLAAV